MKPVDVLIEMPKGASKRTHINWARTHWIDGGPIKRAIPVNEGIMPIDYGFVVGTMIKEGSHKDELDALVYTERKLELGSRIKIDPTAVLYIKNGDNKIIGVGKDTTVQKWEDIPARTRNLLIKYFGYKSPVIKIGDKKDAERLIKKHLTKNPLRIPNKAIIKKEEME